MGTMKSRTLGSRGLVVLLLVICVWPLTVLGADFEIRVLECPQEVLPGMLIDVHVEIRNVSGGAITLAQRGDLEAEVKDPMENRVAPCSLLAFTDSIVPLPNDWKGRELPADWKHTIRWAYCFDTPGKYATRFFLSSVGPYVNRNGEHYEAWEGEVSTPLIKIDVRQPVGVDSEVFEAFGSDALALDEYWGDLLQRFPESTYAAYAIWERWAKGTARPWEDDTAREKSLSWLAAPAYHTWKLPCRADGTPDAGTITRFMMPEAARCRDLWLEIALKHHPDIWFADEMRLKLALDRYMLGDQDACLAGLEALSEHARPYVAEKARALLEAMQSKGMLPGGSDAVGLRFLLSFSCIGRKGCGCQWRIRPPKGLAVPTHSRPRVGTPIQRERVHPATRNST